MKFQVEAVSKYGIKGPTKWYNADRNSEVAFSHLRKGDMVEVALNDKGFMTELNKLSNDDTADSEPTPRAKVSRRTMTSTAHSPVNHDNQAQIARSVVLKSVLDSLILANQVLKMELSPTETDAFIETRLTMYNNYILTGQLSVTKVEEEIAF